MITRKIPHPDKNIFSPGEACGYIGLSWNSLKRVIEKGDISVTRVGRRYLITKASLDEYLNRDNLVRRVFSRRLK